MTTRDEARQRLYTAAENWNPETRYGLTDVVYAAGAALVEGLDSPAMRELAAASVRGELITEVLREFGITDRGARSGIARRDGIDTLRLAIAPAETQVAGELQVQVYVNEVELTSSGAGLGMDPKDIFLPSNVLVAEPRPHTVAIARCECGFYGCGCTDVTITRDGPLVHWDWLIEVPMNRGVTFAAAQYDAELARISG